MATTSHVHGPPRCDQTHNGHGCPTDIIESCMAIPDSTDFSCTHVPKSDDPGPGGMLRGLGIDPEKDDLLPLAEAINLAYINFHLSVKASRQTARQDDGVIASEDDGADCAGEEPSVSDPEPTEES